MKRRIFLKLLGISPVVPSVLMAKEAYSEQPAWVQESYRRQDKRRPVPEPCPSNAMEQIQSTTVYLIEWGPKDKYLITPKEPHMTATEILQRRGEAPWSFYINNKEIDASRATDKFGGLRMPFDGAKDGDVCKFVSRGTIY